MSYTENWLLLTAPALARVEFTAHLLGSRAESLSYRQHLSPDGIADFHEMAADLEKALLHPTLVEVEGVGLNHFRDGLKRSRNASTANDWAEAYASFDAGQDEYWEELLQASNRALGRVGGMMFIILMERHEYDILKEIGSVDLNLWLANLDSPDTIVLDEETFSIRSGTREPCDIGNGNGFQLFKALLNNEGKYVSFDDLAEQMGGDSLDVGTLKVRKHRLCQSLKNGGYEDIASWIQSKSHYYGLFLPPRETEMKPP